MIKPNVLWVGLMLLVGAVAFYSQVWLNRMSDEQALLWTSSSDVSQEYGDLLEAYGEFPLKSLDVGDDAIYRFTVIRSFHGMVVITVNATQSTLSVKASTEPTYVASAPTLDEVKSLADDDIYHFHAALNLSQFLAAYPAVDDDRMGKDGATWLFEVRRGADYAGQKVWSPKDGPIVKIGPYVFDMASEHYDLGPLY